MTRSGQSQSHDSGARVNSDSSRAIHCWCELELGEVGQGGGGDTAAELNARTGPPMRLRIAPQIHASMDLVDMYI